jgi:hypothetical protein
VPNRVRDLGGVAVGVDVHVEHMGALAQHVLAQGGLLDAILLQRQHDRADLGFGEHQITHDHGVGAGVHAGAYAGAYAGAHAFEGHPRAERERRFERDAINRDREVCAGEAEAEDVSRLHRPAATEGALYVGHEQT